MKDTTTSIVKNISVMTGSQIITWGSSLVLMMFLPRYLGDQGYGRLYFAMSITALMGMLIDLGLGNLFIKEIARDRSKASLYYINGIILKILSWSILIALLMGFVIRSGYPRETIDVVLILGFGEVVTGFAKLTHVIFQSYERLDYLSYTVIVERVFLSAVGVALLLAGFGVTTIAVVMVASVILNLVVSLIMLPKLVSIRLNIVPSLWPSLLKQSIPFLLLSCFTFIYYRIDVVMLSEMTNERVVGWYGAPYRLFDTMMFFPSIMHMAVFPVFARLWNDSKGVLGETVRRVLDVTLMVGVLIAILLFTLAKPLVAFLFGLESYSNSVIILQLLALTLPLVYVNIVTGTVVWAADKQRQVSVIAAVAMVLNIGLNYGMIPYFQQKMGNGGIGAAIATTITEGYMMVAFFYLLPSRLLNISNLIVALKSLAIGIVIAIMVWWFQSQSVIYYISGVIGVVCYTATLMAARVIKKQDMATIIDMIRMRRPPEASEPGQA